MALWRRIEEKRRERGCFEMIRKTNFDFYGHRKLWMIISGGILVFGILFNLIFGSVVDIKFTGGAIVKYAFTGDADPDTIEAALSEAIEKPVEIQINRNVISAQSATPVNNLSVSISEGLTVDQQKLMLGTLQEKFADNKFDQLNSDSVDPSMGSEFFLKCLIAVLLAAVLMVVYVAFRFRKIGGWSAGVFALVALVHDIVVVYFTFVIFRLPIDDNFIAVALSILGYSLNDTIVIYDRIRENRRLLGPKTTLDVLVNTSLNQTFSRTFLTALCTLLAVAAVSVVAMVYNIESILRFALPMMLGVLSGFYSTVCLSGPGWVMWQNYKAKKKMEKRQAGKKK